MKKTINLLLLFTLLSVNIFGQNDLKQYKAGHTFNIGLPTYMNRTIGMNTVSAIEYENKVKDIYGIVIFDTKEELQLSELNFGSINEFYEDFIKDFLKDEEKRKVSKIVTSKINNINFIENDVSYFDKDANTEIYYLVGIVETNKSFYKVLSWCNLDNKDKYKKEFQKILYSLND